MKKNTIVDGVNINTNHFGPMNKAEATKRMFEDGMCPGKDDKDKKAWADKAFDLVKAEYDKPEDDGKAVVAKPAEIGKS